MRFGLCGTGYWARETHAAAIAAHPDAELAGVWGRDPARARALAEDAGGRVHADLDALIDDVDAVAVALPPDVQAEIAVRAAAAGRHLILDKPLAFSGEAAGRVVDAVDAAGVRALVFHTARFTPEVDSWLREVHVADDWLGGTVTLMVSIFEPGNPFGQSPWRREKGALWDVGPHALDMVISALGPVQDVVAGRGAGDTVHLVARHPAGRSSTLTLSLTTPPPAQASSWTIHGGRGIWQRPDAGTTPVEAFGNAVSTLIDPSGAGIGRGSDARHGRDIVVVLEAAERFLGGRPASGAAG